MRRALVVLVALLAVVVLAGCGGDDGGGGDKASSSKQDYARQLGVATKALQDAFADTDQVGANVSSAQIIDHREAQATVIDNTVKKLRAITPPAALAATHRKLIEGLEELATSFRSGGGKDTKSLAAALRALPNSTGAKKLTEVSAELKAQGVTVATASK
jgi:predicted small secreted protein